MWEQKWDSESPEKPLPENAVKKERNVNIFTDSLIYGVVPFLIQKIIEYMGKFPYNNMRRENTICQQSVNFMEL